MSLRILVIAPELPLPAVNGGRIRRAHILSALAEKHDVTLVCLRSGRVEEGALEETRKLCRRVITVPDSWKPRKRRGLARWAGRYLPDLGESTKDRMRYLMDCPELREAIASLTREERFDVGLAEYWFMAGHLSACEGVPVKALDVHDGEARRWGEAARSLPSAWERLRASRIGRFVKRHEADCIRSANRWITLSRFDRRWVESLVPPDRIELVPTGVDVEYLPFESCGTPGSLLFVGSLRHAPNVDAVRWVVRDILPGIVRRCAAAKFAAVGFGPPDWLRKLEGPHLETTGEVPTVLPYLKRAQVFLAPIRFKGGIRGKLLEPMAMGVPVVTTSASAEALNATAGDHLAVGDTARELVDRTVELLTDEDRRTSMATAARRFVEENFSWKRIGAHLCETIERWHREMTHEGIPA